MAATGTIAPFPKHQLFTNAGAPAASHKLFTYAAGTTTKLSTYSDVNLSSANANPIVLDSAGRATIFLSAASYKFVLASSTDTDPPTSPIWTVDSVSATPSFNVNLDITGTAGETLVANDIVYVSDGSGGLTAGLWYKTDSDNTYSSVTAYAIGVVISDIASAATGSIRVAGQAIGFAGLTAGSVYYISATAGAITATAPANGRAVGVADSATTVVLSHHLNSPAASASIAGIVTTGTQTIAGAKTFSGAVVASSTLAVTGTSTLTGAVTTPGGITTTHATTAMLIGGRASTNVVDVGNVGAGEDDLMTYSLPAGSLASNGQIVRVTMWGTFAATAAAKTIKAYFGATSATWSAVTLGTLQNWQLQFIIVRTGAATQVANLIGTQYDTSAGVSTTLQPAELAPAETLSGAVTIKLTGTATADNDVVQKAMIVELLL